jgi:hypothetical protein
MVGCLGEARGVSSLEGAHADDIRVVAQPRLHDDGGFDGYYPRRLKSAAARINASRCEEYLSLNA